jgi:predicted ATPase/DNA-binding winged helix-turn-helix (wHTH) protein
LVYEAGAWEIDTCRRELRTRGRHVSIGARAFEIIEALVASAGQLVSKDALMEQVWPGAIVEESTLQVHISAIRKALGSDRAMLKTASGRGYCLAGPWTTRQQNERPADLAPVPRSAEPVQSNLPAATTQLIGRETNVQRVLDLMSAYRVVTLTGPGGIGKTKLALEIARLMLPGFDGAVWLVQLASLSDPGLVAGAIATELGLHIGGNDISPEAVARAIGGRKLLLVVDNCEHVIDAAAETVEMLIRLCPAVSILATSREVMRVEGECAYRVPPLEFPAPASSESGQIPQTSAVQLFIARITAAQRDFRYQDELPAVAAICRRLDGIPLAIEFAAARAAMLGVGQVLSRLDDRFNLLTSGRRTALPRHQTLRATLDWSYELLAGSERHLLRRLAIFADAFSLEAVNAVAGNGKAAGIEDDIANLVAKSLVSADIAGAEAHFRLLETTRAYALARLTESGELQQLARMHADYYRGLLITIQGGLKPGPARLAILGNVRTALEWCFGPNGDGEIGVGLAAAFAPVFHETSMIAERHRWSERAILALDDVTRGGPEEMRLQASFGGTSMHIHGQGDVARVALHRSLAIAEARGDVAYQVGSLCQLSTFYARLGDFKNLLYYERRSQTVAGTADDATTKAVAQSILGRSLHFLGDHGAARVALEASIAHWSGSQGTTEVNLGLDHYIVVGIGLARTLWLQGYPAQALERVRQNMKDAEQRNHPGSLSLALAWALGTFFWAGDLQSAEENTGRLIAHARAHSLGPYLVVARGHLGTMAIRRGDAEAGVESLRTCLEQLLAAGYGIFNTEFKISLVQGLAATGRFEEAITLIDETIGLIEANGDLVYMPEALRVKGSVLLLMPGSRVDDAEVCFERSLELSRRQGALAWELRTAVDLAELLAAQEKRDEAVGVLRPVYERFVEGRDTADVKAAERLLARLA